MFIVDSQVHIWAEESTDRPWVPGGAARLRHMGHREKALGSEELLRMMSEAGVNRALIVPPTWDFDRIDLGITAAERHPDRFGVMARIPIAKPYEAKSFLATWKKVSAIKGVRLTFSFEGEREWITDGTADWYWPYAEENEIATMVLVPFGKSKLFEIAKAYPKLRITIDHMGVLGNTTDAAIEPYIAETARLAALPNVCVKLSNLPSFSTEPYPYRNLNAYIKQLVDAFGAKRCFWGTDLSRMIGKYGVGYREAIAHIDLLPFLSDEEKEWIMGRGISEWLRWKI